MIESLPTELKVLFVAYVIVLGVVLGGITVFGIMLHRLSGKRFLKFCRKISDFCAEAGKIDNDNVEQFDATCMDDRADPAFLEGWNSFKEVCFGYPSEHIDKDKVNGEHDTRKFKLAVTIFSLVSFLLVVVLAVCTICLTAVKHPGEYPNVWALTLCSLIIPLIPLAAYLPASPENKRNEAFDLALEDLDSCVHLQKMVQRKVDKAMLDDIEKRLAAIVDSEQNKPVPSKVEQAGGRKPRKPVKFGPFVSLLNMCIRKIKNQDRLKKVGGLIIAAFGKFREPEQRTALKDSIRSFIDSYSEVKERDRALAESGGQDAASLYDTPAYVDSSAAYGQDPELSAPAPEEPVQDLPAEEPPAEEQPAGEPSGYEVAAYDATAAFDEDAEFAAAVPPDENPPAPAPAP